MVVGTGGIGREIAKLLRAAGLAVRGAGRRVAADDPDFGEIIDSANLGLLTVLSGGFGASVGLDRGPAPRWISIKRVGTLLPFGRTFRDCLPPAEGT